MKLYPSFENSARPDKLCAIQNRLDFYSWNWFMFVVMTTDDPSALQVSTATIIKRGLRGRCPSCGNGKLFKAYLQPHDHCAACNADFTELRADDGPAWLTLLITGHIVAPLATHLVLDEILPNIILIPFMLLLTLGLCLGLLPIAKGFFMAVLWITKQKNKDSKNG